MAVPIPINEAGLRRRRYFDVAASVPVWDARQQIRPQRSTIAPDGRSSLEGTALLAVSGLASSLAIVSALELWPLLAATNLGIAKQDAFHLTVAGIYLLAMALCAAWGTRLLRNLNQTSWDIRLMAYASLAVGGAVVLIMGAIAVAVMSILIVAAWVGALLLSGTGGPRAN